MFLDEFQRYLQSTFRFLESVPRLPPQQGYRVRISRPPLSRPQLPQKPQPQPPPMAQDEEEDEDCQSEQREYPAGQAKDLEKQAAQWLKQLGMADLIPKLTVTWNARLTSTAGYASYPSWRIELNPRLVDFEGQVDRTLRHELAHLVAYQRAGKRRIEPHGDEWRRACVELDIPGEPAHHHLPLPRSQQRRKYAYQCPQCRVVVPRVRPFKRPTACLSCCKKYNAGDYHDGFRFVRVEMIQR
jgi:predicted SprT family Zn-dependent metalloprotease